MYFNYHSKIKKLILNGHLVNYEIVDNWNSIENALVLFFDNHRPIPIRPHRHLEYYRLLGISL
jgi:hypothetical protein